ncbi:MFS general substrate transporter [Atractiella rhizophila]|nr:MFS general substrate transporter [Atractiella rhizophila]
MGLEPPPHPTHRANSFQSISDQQVFEDGPSQIPEVESMIFHTSRPIGSRSRSKKPLRIVPPQAGPNVDAEAGEESPLLAGHGDRDGGDAAARSRSESLKEMNSKPWYRRPAPGWFLPGALITSLSMGIIIGPKLEVYQRLVCSEIQESSQAIAFNDFNLITIPHSLTQQSAPWSRLFDSSNSSQSEPPSIPFPDNSTHVPIMIPSAPDPPPDSRDRCRKDTAVQQAVTQLNVLLTLSMGILSALTTGFWGGFSDRYGRKKIVMLSVLGILVNDAVFWTTVTFRKVLGYKFLIVGPLIEGILGGHTTASAGMGAYISDCTGGGSRAQVFSVFMGLFFAGFTVGPAIGSLILSHPKADLLSPFYVSMTLHTVQLFFILFLLPESLSMARQLETRALYKKSQEEKQLRSWKWKRMFGFLRPLKLLLPRQIGDQEEEEADGKRISRTDLKHGKKDWNLTVLAFAYALFLMSMGIYSIKSIYTMSKFDWGPEEIGFMLSFLGSTRVISLLIVLPLVIRIFRKPPPMPLATPTTTPGQSEITLNGEGDEESRGDSAVLVENTPDWEVHAKKLKILHDSHFDLFLARLSILVDFLSYFLITLSHNPMQFLGASAIQSLAGGGSPALQSLALSLASPNDSGKILAALGVLQGFSSQVLGPLIYGGIYSVTFSKWPEAVFAVAASIYMLAFLILSGVRLPPKKETEKKGKKKGKKRERGRSRTRRESGVGTWV